MENPIELFEKAKNVSFEGYKYCDEVKRELPVYKIRDIPEDEWNRKAKISNTKAFVETFGRDPKDYEEALSWVYSIVEDCKKKAIEAGTYMAVATN